MTEQHENHEDSWRSAKRQEWIRRLRHAAHAFQRHHTASPSVKSLLNGQTLTGVNYAPNLMRVASECVDAAVELGDPILLSIGRVVADGVKEGVPPHDELDILAQRTIEMCDDELGLIQAGVATTVVGSKGDEVERAENLQSIIRKYERAVDEIQMYSIPEYSTDTPENTTPFGERKRRQHAEKRDYAHMLIDFYASTLAVAMRNQRPPIDPSPMFSLQWPVDPPQPGSDPVRDNLDKLPAIRGVLGLLRAALDNDGDAEGDYRPASSFSKKLAGRLRHAAEPTRKTKRVRTKIIEGTKCYNVEDVRRWWPDEALKNT